jgi:hypothetical protein
VRVRSSVFVAWERWKTARFAVTRLVLAAKLFAKIRQLHLACAAIKQSPIQIAFQISNHSRDDRRQAASQGGWWFLIKLLLNFP